MANVAAREVYSPPGNKPAPGKKTVQEYIDELPVWSDGTTLKSTPMTGMQWRIWALAASGKFFEGFVVFMGGVTVPLITREFGLSAGEAGLVTSASLAGILVGTILLGGLSDYFGRKLMFIAEMIIFCLFLALLIMVGGFLSLVICLFGIGMALGCDYPTAHMIISESIPSASRGRLVLGAFAFQAVGAMSGIAVGALVLVLDPSIDAWRWMYATALAPAVVITVGRFFIPESANWLIVRGAHEHAEKAVTRLLHRKPTYPQKVELTRHVADEKSASKQSFFALFNAEKSPRHHLLFGAVAVPGSRHLRHRRLHPDPDRCRSWQRARQDPQPRRPDCERYPFGRGGGPHNVAAHRRHHLCHRAVG